MYGGDSNLSNETWWKTSLIFVSTTLLLSVNNFFPAINAWTFQSIFVFKITCTHTHTIAAVEKVIGFSLEMNLHTKCLSCLLSVSMLIKYLWYYCVTFVWKIPIQNDSIWEWWRKNDDAKKCIVKSKLYKVSRKFTLQTLRCQSQVLWISASRSALVVASLCNSSSHMRNGDKIKCQWNIHVYLTSF